ncbi:hypothetical protein [Pacificibacter marinus]|uniref:Uncharacterized protein n=1 Tax=Pacificibacter marinus TaxID=658057 RepID=A0A1Y5TMM9_9RHOB|nr:hypothetical protein [Pacificibacter marinus]SLN65537.1 hypothetical protein PAM7971_03449 [Pacificibacter marinus]
MPNQIMPTTERYKEALTPSCETKAAYMSEFSIDVPMVDEHGEEFTQQIDVPWTTIKEIMAAISKRAETEPLKGSPQ